MGAVWKCILFDFYFLRKARNLDFEGTLLVPSCNSQRKKKMKVTSTLCKLNSHAGWLQALRHSVEHRGSGRALPLGAWQSFGRSLLLLGLIFLICVTEELDMLGFQTTCHSHLGLFTKYHFWGPAADCPLTSWDFLGLSRNRL